VILTSEIELFEDAISEDVGMDVFGESFILPTDKERITLGLIKVFLRLSKEMKHSEREVRKLRANFEVLLAKDR
jgi:hypothetical protein